MDNSLSQLDGDELPEFSEIVQIGGSSMLYVCTNQKQFDLMDALAQVAGKGVTVDYIINYLKKMPV